MANISGKFLFNSIGNSRGEKKTYRSHYHIYHIKTTISFLIDVNHLLYNYNDEIMSVYLV